MKKNLPARTLSNPLPTSLSTALPARKAPRGLIHVHCGLHDSWREHAAERHQIIVLLASDCAGTLTWCASDEQAEAQKQRRSLTGQHVLFIEKRTPHTFCFDVPTPIIAMNFSDEFLAEFVPDAAWRGVLVRPWFDLLKVDARINSFFECARELCLHTTAKGAHYKAAAHSEGETTARPRDASRFQTVAHPQSSTQPRALSHPHYMHALGLMLTVLLLCASCPRQPGAAGVGLSPEQLRKAQAYIDAHFRESFRITTLYQLVGLGKKSFGKRFKLSTGMLPRRYVLSRRVAFAQKLLREGQLSVGEVANAAGFADQSHMRHCFRLLCNAEQPRKKRPQRP